MQHVWYRSRAPVPVPVPRHTDRGSEGVCWWACGDSTGEAGYPLTVCFILKTGPIRCWYESSLTRVNRVDMNSSLRALHTLLLVPSYPPQTLES